MNIYSDKDYLDAKFSEQLIANAEIRDLLVGKDGLLPRVNRIEATGKAVAALVAFILSALGIAMSK